eukprot:403343588
MNRNMGEFRLVPSKFLSKQSAETAQIIARVKFINNAIKRVMPIQSNLRSDKVSDQFTYIRTSGRIDNSSSTIISKQCKIRNKVSAPVENRVLVFQENQQSSKTG